VLSVFLRVWRAFLWSRPVTWLARKRNEEGERALRQALISCGLATAKDFERETDRRAMGCGRSYR